MYGFNIKPVRKYLVAGRSENVFKQLHKYGQAKEFALTVDGVIYEKLGKGERADWFLLSEVANGKVVFQLLGDQEPRDDE